MNKLVINGEEKVFADGIPDSLLKLIESMGLKASTVVAETNGVIVPRDDFAEFKLNPDDKLELIQFVGGG